jgi:hypothetical protein
MDSFFRFLAQYEIIIYILLGLIGLLVFRGYLVARRELNRSLFGLEKESAQTHASRSLALLILIGFMICFLFVMMTFVTPNIPGIQTVSTPTLQIVITPTPTFAFFTEPTQQEIGFLPTLTKILLEGCIPGQIEWTNPLAGDTITGEVELMGTVNVNNLGYYKYEYRLLGEEHWTTIAAGNESKKDELLGGIWNTSDLIPGDYQLRLVVFDNLNAEFPICQVQIAVKGVQQ